MNHYYERLLVDELLRGDGNGCKHANETMREAAAVIQRLISENDGLAQTNERLLFRAEEAEAALALTREVRA